MTFFAIFIAFLDGPMLVYEWVPGELLGVERSRRADPAAPFQRFRALPFSDLLTGLDVVFDFHRSAAELGWVVVDFYDGAMIYDFATKALRLIDLDNYRDLPFTNEMGRMFGSTRFMARKSSNLARSSTRSRPSLRWVVSCPYFCWTGLLKIV
jgi:hypothetical protein